MEALGEARIRWIDTINDKGGKCPCCDRFGKVYERHFNATMARSLIWLANSKFGNEDGWVDVPNVAPKAIVRTNQLSTVRWWNLIERMKNTDPRIKHSGMWRATKTGIMFARGFSSIPKSVFTYAGDPIRWSEEVVHISETFATQFDYEKVMGEYATVPWET